MADIWHKLKDIFDVVEGLPGLAAFIKVFFGSEAGQKKLEKRLLEDKRDELFEDIYKLPEENRKKLIRRLRQAERRGEEDRLVWNLCKINRKVRLDMLAWLDSLNDSEFKVMVDLLDDDKFHQFAVRMIRLVKGQVIPQVKAAAIATAVVAKKEWPKAKVRLKRTDRSVARQFKQFAKWLDN